MNADVMKRCPHYQIYSEPLHREGQVSYLVVRRCMLTERMLPLLEPSPGGRQLGERTTIQVRTGRRYAFLGPDMEPVTQETCTKERCEAYCTPAYERTLKHFGRTDPEQAEVECENPEEEQSPTDRRTTLLPT